MYLEVFLQWLYSEYFKYIFLIVIKYIFLSTILDAVL